MSSTSKPVSEGPVTPGAASSSPVSAGFAGQMIAGFGAVLCLLFAFGIALPAAGVACLILGVIISAPQSRQPGPFMVEWWTVLALAAMTCLAGFAIHFGIPVLGSILLSLGAVTALTAVGLGSPVETD